MKMLAVIMLLIVTFNANAATEADYTLGQQHGCSTGKVDGGTWGYKRIKDIDLYVNNNYYRTGWDDGYRECKAVADEIGRAIMNNMRW